MSDCQRPTGEAGDMCSVCGANTASEPCPFGGMTPGLSESWRAKPAAAGGVCSVDDTKECDGCQ